MAKDQEEPGFRVTDKRIFREDGSPTGATAPAEDVGNSKSETQKGQEAPMPAEEVPPGTGARIDFPSYILSYYTQGLVLLGEVPNPYTNKKEEDVEAAHHMIDILSMLEEKTKGNLSKEEEQLLGSVLYELRMKFMAKTSRIKL
ncbi:MAG TPA: DUF1844 domain-containing protein [Acidobacteriota bacterium]|nr:DUF1844 domain-containing protein [Acidobacteriota bacterium]